MTKREKMLRHFVPNLLPAVDGYINWFTTQWRDQFGQQFGDDDIPKDFQDALQTIDNAFASRHGEMESKNADI